MIEHPVISSKIADMAMEIDAARLLYMRAAWYNSQRGKESMAWSTMAKVYASDMAMRVTTDCVQVMGSNGYSKEYGVEKYMRDAKIVQIYIGANELCRQVIGEEL
jgi:butyryl-CoA dehydrogenase